MPNKTIYIRNSDVEKWDALKDKSQKVHEMLQGKVQISVGRVLSSISDGRLPNGLCKDHGTPLDSRGKCLQKGCKYA